jgi:CRISPR/Cas system CMR subunit Cmr4 (Cas7 group RAMP superfamily)
MVNSLQTFRKATGDLTKVQVRLGNDAQIPKSDLIIHYKTASFRKPELVYQEDDSFKDKIAMMVSFVPGKEVKTKTETETHGAEWDEETLFEPQDAPDFFALTKDKAGIE